MRCRQRHRANAARRERRARARRRGRPSRRGQRSAIASARSSARRRWPTPSRCWTWKRTRVHEVSPSGMLSLTSSTTPSAPSAYWCAQASRELLRRVGRHLPAGGESVERPQHALVGDEDDGFSLRSERRQECRKTLTDHPAGSRRGRAGSRGRGLRSPPSPDRDAGGARRGCGLRNRPSPFQSMPDAAPDRGRGYGPFRCARTSGLARQRAFSHPAGSRQPAAAVRPSGERGTSRLPWISPSLFHTVGA